MGELDEAFAALAKCVGGDCGNVFIRRNDGPASAEWVVTIDYYDLHGTATASGLKEAIYAAIKEAES